MDSRPSSIADAEESDGGFEPLSVVEESNLSNPRNYLSQTDPSLYKINQNSPAGSSSLEILREFMSRPDVDSKKSSTFQGSDSSSRNQYWGFRSLNRDQGEGLSGSIHTYLSTTGERAEVKRRGKEKSKSPEKSHPEMTEVESPLGRAEYRCPGCNRLCKSKESFEKHQNACTHKNGALTLKCRFCYRPYTYIGYLHKHEIACSQLEMPPSSASSEPKGNPPK